MEGKRKGETWLVINKLEMFSWWKIINAFGTMPDSNKEIDLLSNSLICAPHKHAQPSPQIPLKWLAYFTFNRTSKRDFDRQWRDFDRRCFVCVCMCAIHVIAMPWTATAKEQENQPKPNRKIVWLTQNEMWRKLIYLFRPGFDLFRVCGMSIWRATTAFHVTESVKEPTNKIDYKTSLWRLQQNRAKKRKIWIYISLFHGSLTFGGSVC